MNNEIEAALVSAIPNAERLKDLLGSVLDRDTASAIVDEARALLAQIGEAVDLAAAKLVR